MAETTGISWADATFNPWIGCDKITAGCKFCYAEDLVTGRMGRPNTWGAAGVRERTSTSNWKKPLAWERQAAGGRGDERTGIGRAILRGDRPRIFCASLADVFELRPELDPWRSDLFALIEQTPSLDWLVLTKRPDVARDWLYRHVYYPNGMEAADRYEPIRNLWLGTSIENSRFTWRADVLREIPAAVRFISAEPLLGSLFEHPRASLTVPVVDGELQIAGEDIQRAMRGTTDQRAPLDLSGIDWVIVGGESGGRDARPMHPAWPRELRDACLAACGPCNGVGTFDGHVCEDYRPAYHMKQWGSHAPVTKTDPRAGDVWVYPDGHTETWQEGDGLGLGDITVAERDEYGIIVHPDGSGAALVRYAGANAHSGGKYLDRVDWCEVPSSPAEVAA